VTCICLAACSRGTLPDYTPLPRAEATAFWLDAAALSACAILTTVLHVAPPSSIASPFFATIPRAEHYMPRIAAHLVGACPRFPPVKHQGRHSPTG